MFNKGTPLESCPNRVAKPAAADVNKIPNGCSVPLRAQPGVEAIMLWKYHRWTWNFDNLVGGGDSTSFKDACNAHDICYAKCNNPAESKLNDFEKRKKCDEKVLLESIKSVCSKLTDQGQKDSCDYWQLKYVGWVREEGDASFAAAQKKWCKCCSQ
jgi:hypothetical protein